MCHGKTPPWALAVANKGAPPLAKSDIVAPASAPPFVLKNFLLRAAFSPTRDPTVLSVQ